MFETLFQFILTFQQRRIDTPFFLLGLTVFQLLQLLIQTIQLLLVPICFVSAWGIVFLIGWSLWAATRDTVLRSRQMHQIPCSECRFFTHDYHLKCTVHPATALTEAAINCPDFEPGKPQPLVPKISESIRR